MAKYKLKFDGEEIDRRLEDVDRKAGLFYYDSTNNRYLVFTNENARDEYLDDTSKVELIVGTFDAPFNYSAKIMLESKAYNAVSLGSTGHFLDFTFDIENKNGQSTGENVICTYIFRKGSTKQTVVEQYAAGRSVHFNIDKYISEGTNNITIAIQGVTSLAATTASVTYQVVNLSIGTRYDISSAYNLVNGSKVMEIPFSVSGYGTKVVEWYIDGELLPFVKDEDEVVDSSVERTKYITLNNLSQGRHSLQLRAYTVVNGESFYTDTLYRDIIVYTAQNTDPIIAVAVTIPKEHGILGVNDTISIYNMVQYVPYTLEFATYSPSNASSLDTQILLDGELKGSVQSVNGMVNTFSVVPKTSGNKNLKIKVGDIEHVIPTKVAATTMKLQEITNNLVLNFDAVGRSNNATNKDVWSYGNYTGSLNGFNWNNTSGWVNNRLEMNAGASFAINLAPLFGNPTAEGKTIELEWSTKNVRNDNAVICDLRENGVGICIYATKVSMTSADGVVIETEYKSDENVRVAFVINRAQNATNKGLSFIYANGIVSRADNWAESDSYESNATIKFEATDEVEISLKAIRIYNAALTNDQILNNYILYRDTIEEMTEVYDRNDVYAEGTSTFDPERMMGRLPVMIVTGDIPTLENTSDKDTQITVDIEYINMQDRSLSFTMKNAAMRPQGTSSMGYPKKNFRIYTKKVYNTQLFDADGNEVEDKLYSFRPNSQPVSTWCLKADYAESSGTHNTGIARLWNEALFNAQIQHENILGEVTNGYALRTNAQQIALMGGYPYDVRTTIDGFPILLFYRPSINDDLIFIGKYNFNNDKSTESVFGFKGIPNFDNSKMQCWEILNNGNALALFQTMEGFDENWSEAYESRYPDTKTPYLGDLKAFSQWMTTVTMERFATEKWQHLDVYKMAAYWCYLMRHAGADQFVKNAMFTSEDGQHFYFILYDNDTINGLINTGRLKIKPTDTRYTTDETGSYVFAGHDSRLWNMLEADSEFNRIVSIVDNALYSSGISYQNTIRIFDNEQADKWVERVYNQDAQYKYVSPYVEKGVDNLFMLQGKRDLHRKWWLSKRFAIYDAKYVSGTYKSQAIEIKCINGTPAGQKFTITSGYPLSYGYGINNVPRQYGIDLEIGDSHTFTTEEVINLGDPVRIYGAPNIAGVNFSQMSDKLAVVTIANVYDEAQGTNLTTLILGGKPNYEVTEISGLDVATSLEHIDVSEMTKMLSLNLSNHKYIKTVKAQGSGIASITFAKGAPVETLELPTAIRVLTLEQLPYLSAEGLTFEDLSSVQGFSIKSCPNLSNNYELIREWMRIKTTEDSKCTLVMDNINWEGVSGAEMVRMAQLGNVSLKGKIKLTNINKYQGVILTSVFGESIYDPNAELYIDAPYTVSVNGALNILEGESATYTWEIYPPLEGSVKFSLSEAREGCSINNEGELITLETGIPSSSMYVVATFTGVDGKVISGSRIVNVSQRTYPIDATLTGVENPTDNPYYTVNYPTAITGEYTVEWFLVGYVTEYLEIANASSRGCELVLTYPPMQIATGALIARFKKNFNGEVFLELTQSLSVYIEGVVITKKTNEPIQNLLYKNNLVANANYSLQSELEKIKASQLNPSSDATTSIFYSSRSTITKFDEFEYFTGVTRIPRHCFSYLTKMTTIKLPPTITSIDNQAFGVTGLTGAGIKSLVIPEGVVSIGDSAFIGCLSLASVTLPTSLVSMGESVFASCKSLATINIPSGVSNIKYRTFHTCSKLTSLIIPDTVTTLGSQVFVNSGLKTIKLSNSLSTLPQSTFEGCSSLQTITIPSGIRSIENSCFSSCVNLKDISCESAQAPSVTSTTFGDSTSTYTGRNSYNTGENTLRVPQNATGYEASYWGSVLLDATKCGFKAYGKLTINSNKSDAKFQVTYITTDGSSKTIELGIGTVYIADVKYGAQMTIVPLPIANYNWDWDTKTITYNGAIEIINNAYIYPSSVTINGSKRVTGGTIATYTANILPNNTDVDVTYTWSYSGSSSGYISSTDGNKCIITTITPDEDESFTLTCVVNDGKKIISDTLEGTVLTRPNYILATYNVSDNSSATQLLHTAYKVSEIKYMEIDGEEVTPTLSYTFKSLGFHDVKFSLNTLTSAFAGATALELVDFYNCNGSKYTTMASLFNGCSGLISIDWGDCKFPNVTSIVNMFQGCSKLTSIDLSPLQGASITSLYHTFYNCSSLKSVNLTSLQGAPITDLGSAFSGCTNLKSIDLSPLQGASIEKVSFMFEGCKNLTTIDLSPLSFTSVTDARRMFINCSNLQSVNLSGFRGAPITTIGYMFSGCSELRSVDLSPFQDAPITSLYDTFRNCTKLTSIDLTPLKNAQITMMNGAFMNCSNLSNIIAAWKTAPVAGSLTFSSTGKNVTGTKTLYVPSDSTGYDSVYWGSVLLEPTKCGFRIVREYANGLYIQHVNGSLYTYDEWNNGRYADEKAEGVAIVSDSCSFVMAKENLASQYAFGGYGMTLAGVQTHDSDAMLDFNGRANTTAVISALKGKTDSKGIQGSPAATAATEYQFPSGRYGYLGSAGEWQLVRENKNKVQRLSNLIGAIDPMSGTNWTSSVYDNTDYAFRAPNEANALDIRPRYDELSIIPFVELF